MERREIEELIDRINRLTVSQQQHIVNIIDQAEQSITQDHHDRNTVATETTHHNTTPSRTSSSSVEKPFIVGERVRILNSRQTGKKGDIAEIVKVNKRYLTLRLEKNKSQTCRDPKYVERL